MRTGLTRRTPRERKAPPTTKQVRAQEKKQRKPEHEIRASNTRRRDMLQAPQERTRSARVHGSDTARSFQGSPRQPRRARERFQHALGLSWQPYDARCTRRQERRGEKCRSVSCVERVGSALGTQATSVTRAVVLRSAVPWAAVEEAVVSMVRSQRWESCYRTM